MIRYDMKSCKIKVRSLDELNDCTWEPPEGLTIGFPLTHPLPARQKADLGHQG